MASAVKQANEREHAAEAEVRDAMKRIDELELQQASLSQAHNELVGKLQLREKETQTNVEQLEASVNALNDTLRQLHEAQRQHELLAQQNDSLETGLKSVQEQSTVHDSPVLGSLTLNHLFRRHRTKTDWVLSSIEKDCTHWPLKLNRMEDNDDKVHY